MIYFVQQDPPHGPVKIGYAADVYRRVVGIQTASPYPVLLLAAFDPAMIDEDMTEVEVEKKYHRQFHRLHMRGEWFRADTEILSTAAACQAAHDRRTRAALQAAIGA